jgi:hypothetical protein
MSMLRAVRALALAFLGLSAAGCDEDPVNATGRIVIELSGIKETDIVGGSVQKSKNVTTESGNPYGAFLHSARQTLGRDPSRIRVTATEMTLDPGTTGVASFAELFNGTVEVILEADVGGTVAVARVSAPTGTGPIAMGVIADDAALAPILAALLDGNFRVGIRGTTALTAADDFDARIDVGIGFAAYE